MARLYKLNEFTVWFEEWKKIKKLSAHKEFFGKVAQEQRANLDSILFDRKHTNRVPTWCDIDEYKHNVETLEAYIQSI